MFSRKTLFGLTGGLGSALIALPAWAQEVAGNATAAVAEAAPAAVAAFTPTADMVNKGDTAWMLTSSVLVLMMSVPALALFYGGLVRTKNMLSVLMQVFMIVSIAALVWVGWFGFNAGSNLEANGITAVAFINTFVATAAAAVSWALVEQIKHGRPSLLGAVTGAVAGLVAITPASGFAHPGTAIILGFVVSPVCFFFVSYVKNKFKYDDTLDVFGVHCIGGIVGAIGTGIVADPALGGQGWIDYTAAVAKAGEYSMSGQVITQLWAVGTTLLWSGIGSAILFFVIDKTMGLRPSEEAEREGLDLSSHGERAYNY